MIETGIAQLDINALERLIATVDGTAFDRQLTSDTIILSEDGMAIFQSSNCYNAIFEFFNYFDERGLIYPSKIWMNKSPCQQSVHIFIAKYYDGKVIPTIHISELDPRFTLHGLVETIESSKCLAVMMDKGIEFKWWDWQEFKKTLNLKTNCEEIIDSTTNTTEFMQKQEELEALLKYVREIQLLILEKKPSGWCPEPLKIAAWRGKVNKLMWTKY